jgi:hypothetical protein
MLDKRKTLLLILILFFFKFSYSQFSEIEKQIIHIIKANSTDSINEGINNIDSISIQNPGYSVFRFFRINNTDYVNFYHFKFFPYCLIHNDTTIQFNIKNTTLYHFENYRIVILDYKSKKKLFCKKLKLLSFYENFILFNEASISDDNFEMDTNKLEWKTFKIQNDKLIEMDKIITPVYKNEMVDIDIENGFVTIYQKMKNYNYYYRRFF